MNIINNNVTLIYLYNYGYSAYYAYYLYCYSKYYVILRNLIFSLEISNNSTSICNILLARL